MASLIIRFSKIGRAAKCARFGVATLLIEDIVEQTMTCSDAAFWGGIAEVAKLADALASGASGGNPVEVQVLSSAPPFEIGLRIIAASPAYHHEVRIVCDMPVQLTKLQACMPPIRKFIL